MKQRHRAALAVGTLAAALAPLSLASAAERLFEPVPASGGDPGPSRSFVSGEVLVRFTAPSSPQRRTDALEQAGGELEESLPVPRLRLVDLDPGVSVGDAVRELEQQPSVAYAEPNYLLEPAATPNDGLFGLQWALDNTGQAVNGTTGVADADIDAPEAWARGTGSSAVTVGVLDTGVLATHPDLASNIWTNPGEIAGNGIDDDNNGYVDDVHGYDFADNDNDPSPGTSTEAPHGTHVAGIVGAAGNNSIGGSGVNWNVSLVPLKVFPNTSNSATVSDEVKAIAYAGVKGLDVVNGSVGSLRPSTQSEIDALNLASGTLFVFSAGNDSNNNDVTSAYPSGYQNLPNVLSVAATNQSDALPSFSNYGATTVTLGAPGVNVLSTYISGTVGSTSTFESGADGWTTGGINNSWGLSHEQPQAPSSWDVTDSPGGSYLPNTNSFIQSPSIDLGSLPAGTSCHAVYYRVLDTELGADFFRLYTSPDGATFTQLATASGQSTNTFQSPDFPASLIGDSSVFLRIYLTSNANATVGDGIHLDNIRVTCSPYYEYLNGTSMAAPQVAGAAALLASEAPSAPASALEDRIKATVDPLGSLAGKTTSGGRLNLNTATTPPDTTIDSGPGQGSTVVTAQQTFAFHATGMISALACSIDSAPYQACSSGSSDTRSYAEGDHDFAVRSTFYGLNDPTPATRHFTVDLPPAAPVLSGTSPASPADDNAPKVLGSAQAGSSVSLYLTSDCSGSPAAAGTAAELSGAGIAIGVADDSSNQIRATATDGGGTSPCSAPIAYVEDSTPPAAPSLSSTVPAGPANDNAPRVLGSAQAGSSISLYFTADCSGSPAATGTAAQLSSPGITVTVLDDSVSQIRATASDAGGASLCSSPISYVEDSTPPTAPLLTATSPASPANDNAPKVIGSAQAGASISLFFGADCSGPAVATGTAAALASPGIAVSVLNGSTTQIRATATDAGGTSPCSDPIAYTEDSPPAAPTLTATSPVSPANNNSPKVIGSAQPGSSVSLYSGSDCSGSPIATGTAAGLASPGITIAVPDDSTTQIRATATNGIGPSTCSAAITYIEDSPPAAPVLTSTSPASPANNNSPKVIGSAQPGSTISLYATPACSGTALATGTAAQLAGPGIAISVADDSTTQIRATATDGGGTSACSASISYVEDSPPAAPSLTSTLPAGPANDNSPKVIGSAQAGSTVKLFLTATCSGSPVVTGTAAALADPGLTVSVADDTTTQIRATATDGGGSSPCSAPISYVEDSPPAAPILGSLSPASPANDNAPKVFGAAQDNSSVSLFLSADCSGTPAATGTAAQLSLLGIAITVPDNSTTQVRATATDGGGTSSCSNALSYTEDSAGPPASITSGPAAKRTKTAAKLSFGAPIEPGLGFECKLDKAAFVPCTSPKSYSKLKVARHTFTVRAIDALGNRGPSATRSWTVIKKKKRKKRKHH